MKCIKCKNEFSDKDLTPITVTIEDDGFDTVKTKIVKVCNYCIKRNKL